LIVSEETGLISVAAFGDIETGVTIERVDERIQQHFGVQQSKISMPGRPVVSVVAKREDKVNSGPGMVK
jgi:hypothetical protein